MEDQQKEISLGQALLPVIILVVLLAFNVFVFGDDALGAQISLFYSLEVQLQRLLDFAIR